MAGNRVRKARAKAAGRRAPAPPAEDAGLLRLPRLVGNKAFGGMVRETRPLSGPPLQRVVLHDVDFDKLRHIDEGHAYMEARPFVDEYEIAQSAHVLGNLYGMKVLPIRKPSDLGNAMVDEALVLVGHGGQGAFMNMDPSELDMWLRAWNVSERTQVVLAGCSTASAGAAIKVVKSLTGRHPIVNGDLAFTVPGHGEYLVPDAAAVRALFKARNDELRRIDLAMLQRVRDRMRGAFFAAATKENYAFAVEVVQVFRSGNKQKPLVVAGSYTASSGGQVTLAWNEVLNRFEPGNKVGAADVMKAVMTTLKTLSSSGSDPARGAAAAVLAELPGYFKDARTAAKQVMNEFLDEIPKVAGARPTKYLERSVRALLKRSFPTSVELPEEVLTRIVSFMQRSPEKK